MELIRAYEGDITELSASDQYFNEVSPPTPCTRSHADLRYLPRRRLWSSLD